MTYTIVARCPETNALGVGIATYSLGVGGYCPFLARGLAALSTQAFANPTLGPIALDALKDGKSPDNVMRLLAESDPGFSYRQVAIVGADGAVAMHTGDTCRPFAGHVVGDGYAAFGNVLAGEHVVAAIAKGFETSKGQRLDERLMLALEAGRDSGGQAGGDGALGLDWTEEEFSTRNRMPAQQSVLATTQGVGEFRIVRRGRIACRAVGSVLQDQQIGLGGVLEGLKALVHVLSPVVGEHREGLFLRVTFAF